MKEFVVGGFVKDELEGKVIVKVFEKFEKIVLKLGLVVKEVFLIVVCILVFKGKEGFKIISMIEKFYCWLSNLYEILLNDRSWKVFI